MSAISLRPSTYLSRVGKKCQMPTAPPVSAMARAWSALTCRPFSGVGPIARDPSMAVCDNSRGLDGFRLAGDHGDTMSPDLSFTVWAPEPRLFVEPEVFETP